MRLFAATVALMLAATPAARPAHAAYTLTFKETATGVTAVGSGTLNINGMRLLAKGIQHEPMVNSGSGYAVNGAAARLDILDAHLTGPAFFGTSCREWQAAGGTGDITGLEFARGLLGVPEGYRSGTHLSGSSTFPGLSLSGMGLLSGSYTYLFGDCQAPDHLTVQVLPAPVPEPASLFLVGTSLVGAGLVLRARGRSRER